MNRETMSFKVAYALNMQKVSSSMMLNRSWQQAVMRKEICSSLLTRLLEKPKLSEVTVPYD
jgi:hypothetical protein